MSKDTASSQHYEVATPADLEVTHDQTLVYASFRLHRTGITPIGSPTREDWQQVGTFIKQVEKSVHFWIGDWLNYGEKQWGHTYEQAEEATGFDNQTLRNDKWVASRVPLSLRRDNLSYHHHKEVAAYPPGTQALLLEKTEQLG